MKKIVSALHQTMSANNLVSPGAKSVADMVFTNFVRYIAVSTCDRLDDM